MRYRMIALDLDGTLLNSRGEVSQENRCAVAEARAAGAMVVVCTGRGLTESRVALEALGRQTPVVLAGGALVSDPTTGRTLHRSIIEPALAHELTVHMEAAGHAVLLLLDPEPAAEDYLVVKPERLTPNTRWWFEAIRAKVRGTAGPDVADMHHVLRVGVLATPDEMQRLQDSLVAEFGARVMVQHFMAVKQADEELHVLETFAAGVSKWAGLRWLAAEHGIADHEVAAIGDHVNDLPMIEAAGCGVAMANAIPSVLRAAKRVTGSQDDHGVAAAIRRMVCGEW